MCTAEETLEHGGNLFAQFTGGRQNDGEKARGPADLLPHLQGRGIVLRSGSGKRRRKLDDALDDRK